MYISSIAGLKLRSNPDINSQTLELIPFMEKVQIIEEKKDEEFISKRYGKWCNVSWGDKKGWIFSAYLSDYNINGLTEKVSEYYKNYYKTNKNDCDDRFANISSNDIKIIEIFQDFVIIKIPALCNAGSCNDTCSRPILWNYNKSNTSFTKFYDVSDYSKSGDEDLTDLRFVYLDDNNKPSLVAISSWDGGQSIYLVSDINNISFKEKVHITCNWSDVEAKMKRPEYNFDKCNETKIKCLDEGYENIEEYSYDCKTENFYKIEKK